MIPINFQSPTKAERSDDGSLLVHTVFFTLQGEGPNVGQRAVFVRLAGCNLQCPGCDTEYTDGATRESPEGIARRIAVAHGDYTSSPCLVVITGGEPFRQQLIPLINLLLGLGYRVQIETNGTLGFSNLTSLCNKAWRELEIVCSPKAGKVAENILPFITAYKYVVNADDISDEDGLPLSVLGMPAKPARPQFDFEGIVYVQPADETLGDLSGVHKNHFNLQAAINSVMKHGYTLCIQTHKIAGLA